MKQNRTIALAALAAALAAALLLGGCERGGTDSPPGVVPDAQFVVVRQASNAPSLAAREATFWAKAGDNAEVRIPYTTGENCLEFKIPGNGLLRRPDGTAFRRGDSIQVTIRVLDPNSFKFEFQPSGLRFDPGHPAELRMRYRYADPDLNGDGRVDSADESSRLAIWRQEADGQPWVRIGTVRDADADEVRADLQGFTKYAMASN